MNYLEWIVGDLKAVEAQFLEQDCDVFVVRQKVSSESELYSAIRAELPLDPPLFANPFNGDALLDSLCAGLSDDSDRNVVVIFNMAMGSQRTGRLLAVLNDVCERVEFTDEGAIPVTCKMVFVENQ